MFAHLFKAATLLCLSSTLIAAESPGNPEMLGMRTYTQELTLVFASAEDAAKAKLVALPVFEGKKWAFSARWDDNNGSHLRMHDAMKKHGLMGTFYLNQGTAPPLKPASAFGADYARKLMADGFSIGVHCQTHPFLPTQTPNEMFYEMLANRVERECQTGRPINTMVFPYGQHSSSMNPSMHETITEVFVRSGIHNTTYRDFVAKNPGLRPLEVSTSYQVTPGDRTIDAPGFDKQMEHVLKQDPVAADAHCINLGVHVWQSGKAWDDLDALFAKYSHRPDFWYCNMEQYSAYERQFRHSRLEALPANGASRTFRITRPIGAELGDDIPLTLAVQDGSLAEIKANGFDCQKIESEGRTLLQVAHTEEQKVPTRIDGIDNADNAPAPAAGMKLTQFPDLHAWAFVDTAAKTFTLNLENGGAAALAGLHLTLRLPPVYTDGMRRIDLPDIPAGEKRALSWPLGTEKPEAGLHDGRQYLVAELDFRAGAQRGRIYATTRLPGSSAPPRECLRDAVRTVGPVEPAFDAAALQKESHPNAPFEDVGATPDKKWFSSSAEDSLKFAADCLPLWRADREWMDAAAPLNTRPLWRYAIAVDFTLSEATSLRFALDGKNKAAAIYLNGEVVPADKLGGVAGVNRLIVAIDASEGRSVWSPNPVRMKLEPVAGTLKYQLPSK